MSVGTAGRRLTLATLASCLACSLTAGVAGALSMTTDGEAPAPEVVMREFDPAEFSPQAAELPPDLVDAIGRDLDITAEEYLASAAAAKVADKVIRSLGDAVSAAWLDGQTLHVAVQDRSAEAKVAATGATAHVGDSLTDAVDAARGQGQVAYADRGRDEVVPVEADVIGEPAQTTQRAPEPEPTDRDKLRGGYGYTTMNSPDSLFQYRCTAAFNGTTADGDPASLTAGHCAQQESGSPAGSIELLGLALLDDPDDTDEPETKLIDSSLLDDLTDDLTGDDEEEEDEDEEEPGAGEFVTDSARFGDGHDVALVEITEDGWKLRPEVAAMAGEERQGQGLPIYDSIEPVVGAPVCKSGTTSGWTCGNVLDDGSTIPVSGADISGFMSDACTLTGDDGGPVVVGNYALGVSSGSTWTTTDCADSEASKTTQIAVGYPVTGGERNAAALYEDDWNLSIQVGTPEVIAPVEGDVTGLRPTFRGRIDAAAGTTIVVDLDGGEPVKAEVQPDGQWSAPITEPLPSGRHSYTVSASHTAAAASEATTSTTATETFEVAEVATLSVRTPTDDETTTIGAPRFVGTGDPGASITLAFDEETATTTVDDDGTWTVSPSDGPRAGRFDATVTQDTGNATDEVTVERVGIVPGAPLVDVPTGDIASGYVITGTGIPRSTIALRVQPEQDADAGGTPAPSREHVTATDDEGGWTVELGELRPGLHSVSAVQAVDDLTSERSASVALEVSDVSPGVTRAPADDDDIAQTGSSSTPLILAGLALLVLGVAGAAVARRGRRAAQH